jgi:Mg-chelatase subunit ChlD
MVIADTSDGAATALTHMRAGITALIDALPADSEVALVSTGRQTRVRVQPTADHKKMKDAADGLFADGGATVLEDTLLDIDNRFIRKAENRWPVFVIVTGDGPEGSAGANEKKFNDWVVALPSRGISAHAIVMKFKGGGMPEVVANHVAVSAGGIYDFVNTSNSLPDKLKAIGDRIAADAKQMSTWYEVEFQSETPQPQPVDVGVARGGVKLRMSYQRHAQ